MSAILFRRFLADPLKIAYVVPSSKPMIRRVLDKLDFARGRVFVEFGGGEGCYTRELVKRLAPEARLLVFELDEQLAEHLRKQFLHDGRVLIFQQDAATFRDELHKIGIREADYVVSGIPFSYLEPKKKREILLAVHEGLTQDGKFVVYQVTPELKRHTQMFAEHEVEYFLANIPPMFIVACHKSSTALHLARRPNRSPHSDSKNAARNTNSSTASLARGSGTSESLGKQLP
jgi:phosphatidylethanolamine/phosphatidyl-N-methylethanolamine N-methyltransferase